MNRAGFTTHLISPGRGGASFTACGQHITHLHAGHAFRSKPRAVPLLIAPNHEFPTCRRCAAKHPMNTIPKFDHVAHARKLARRPGSSWRFQTGGSLEVHSDPGTLKIDQRFDEVVVDDWLHAEMMDTRSCFVTVGALALWLKLTPSGAEITHVEIRVEGDKAKQIADLLARTVRETRVE